MIIGIAIFVLIIVLICFLISKGKRENTKTNLEIEKFDLEKKKLEIEKKEIRNRKKDKEQND
ncbi:hypothetical protein [Candidatus Mycoplasma mahonii]|uniref:hypothetical protein n=1 Tax=Candidatus Mycoplasma mahonii TaxID=3004105 RepID=UPI0026EBBFDA|nr:hypothetical protein [Candidatus Mycoplasma mahonii]WKX02282.1 hypothetical protein O3I44_02660 [Candidatus Mycoplasma mahonii]